MRSFSYFLGVIVLSSVLFSACNENITDSQPVNSDHKLLAKHMDKFQHVDQVMKANNLEGHAYFIEPQSSGYGIGVIKNLEFDCSRGPICVVTAG